jgi:predicted nucleic acid-binding protein
MILGDTNVFSELVRPAPDDRVVEWAFGHRNETLLSTIVVAEIDIGIRTTRGAAMRTMLAGWLDRLIAAHRDRIVAFDLAAARCWAEFGSAVLISDRRVGSRQFDSLITAQALALGVPIATRNVSDFEGAGVRVINPWEA